MGGSQLSQLKQKLKDSGLSRTSNPKDARKRTKQRKDLSASSLQHRNAKFQEIADQFNVFDVREDKKKFAVVTRRGTEEAGVKGAPSKSRSAGIEQRKKTLLPMLEARTHASTFVDHRFGETASHLTPEEKALERFTAERQSRLNKKTKFNLDDAADEGEIDLTHGGRKLGFGDEDHLEDEGWGGAIADGGNSQPLMNRRKMGVDEPEEPEEPERKKTHAEIMEEVVAKAKHYKAERQRAKSNDDTTRLELDAGLKDLRSILAGGGVPRPSAPASSTSTPAASTSKLPAAGSAAAEDSEEEDDDEDDDDLEGDSDSDGEGSDGEGSTYELNDEELEQMLAASSAKSGVDRDLLRKLIGKAADGSDSEDGDVEEDAPIATASGEEYTGERPAPAKQAEEVDADPYDLYVRQLALEPRAQATNRLRTPLELAQEAAETLKKQEEKRLKRARGERDDSDDDEDEEGGKKKKDKKRAPQGDDLDDGFLQDEYGSEAEVDEEMLEGGADAVRGSEKFGKGLEGGVSLGGEDKDEDEDEEEEEEEEEDIEEEGSDEEEEESDDELDVGDLDAESGDDEEQGETEALVAPLPGWSGKPTGELPYTFPCPSTHAEFAKLLTSSGIKEEDTVTVVKRIRTLYHPGLAVGNKEKLQVFTNVLLDHVIYLCAASSSPSIFSTVNSLLPSLLTLIHANPLTTSPHFTLKLSLMHKNLLRGLSKGPLDPSSKTWPSLPELTLLRLVGMTWSTSDFSHPVAAPSLLLIGEYLSQCRIRSLSDIASGLFLATLAAQYEKGSDRVVPEVLNFVTLALAVLLPTSAGSQRTFSGNFPCPDLGGEHIKPLKLRPTTSSSPVSLSGTTPLLAALSKKAPKGEDAEQLKAELVSAALKLVDEFRGMQSGSEAFVEMFQPVEKVLKGVKAGKVAKDLQDQLTTTLTSLMRSLSLSLSTRRPLSLQTHRAIPLATFLPKFDEGFNPNRKFDPDSERAEASKIRQLYRKEKKGAVRELRNDNKFLAGEQQRRKKEEDATYEKKIGKIMRGLQDERAEEKALERTKDKGKRNDKARAGRK